MTRQRLQTAAVVVVLTVIGFFGMWDDSMRTLSFIFVCTFICILFGIPIGVLMARYGYMRSTVTPILDVMQTMPSFVYLIPVVMLFGVGKVPGAIAVIAYAIPPVIRLTDLGIRLVDREVLEASEAFGASSWQKLIDVQIPLALPNILAGVNQTIMMALAMVGHRLDGVGARPGHRGAGSGNEPVSRQGPVQRPGGGGVRHPVRPRDAPDDSAEPKARTGIVLHRLSSIGATPQPPLSGGLLESRSDYPPDKGGKGG